MKYPHILSHCAGLAVVFIWSGWITLSRYGMQTALTPGDLTMLRYATALICVVPVMFYLNWRRHGLATWLVVGLGVGFPYTLLSFYGLKTTGAAHAGVLVNGMLPVFGAVAAYFVFRQRISVMRYMAIGIVFIANCLMAGKDIVHPELLGGFCILMAAALVYTVHMTGVRYWNVDFTEVLVMVPLVNVLLFLPFYLGMEHTFHQVSFSSLAVQAVYQGIIVNIGALTCVAFAIRHIGTIAVSLYMSFVPVTTAILGWLFLHESLSGLEVAGIAGCTCGLLVYGLSGSFAETK